MSVGVVEVDQRDLAGRGGPDRLHQRPGRRPVVGADDCQVIRPAVHWAESVRAGQRSTSTPSSWLAWPGMSPPCSKPMSPSGTGPLPPPYRATAASNCPTVAPVPQLAAPLPSGSWSHMPGQRRVRVVPDQVAPGGRADHAVRGDAGVALEGPDRGGGAGAEDAVDREAEPALLVQLRPAGADGRTGRALPHGLHQRTPGLGADHAVLAQTVGGLEAAHRGRGAGPEDAVRGDGDVARLQQVLRGQHVDAAVAGAQGVEARLREGLRRRGQADDGRGDGGEHEAPAGEPGSGHGLSSVDGGAAWAGVRWRGREGRATAPGQIPQLGALQERRGPLSTWVWSLWFG